MEYGFWSWNRRRLLGLGLLCVISLCVLLQVNSVFVCHSIANDGSAHLHEGGLITTCSLI